MAVRYLVVAPGGAHQAQRSPPIHRVAGLGPRKARLREDEPPVGIVVAFHMVQQKGIDHHLGVELRKDLLEREKRLVRAISLNTQIDGLERETWHGGQPANEGLLERQAVAEGVGAAHEKCRGSGGAMAGCRGIDPASHVVEIDADRAPLGAETLDCGEVRNVGPAQDTVEAGDLVFRGRPAEAKGVVKDPEPNFREPQEEAN